MEAASLLRTVSPFKLILSLSEGAVVCAVLDQPLDLDDFQEVRTVTALNPARGWAQLGAYNARERTFENSVFVLDPHCGEGHTTEYVRLVPEY